MKVILLPLTLLFIGCDPNLYTTLNTDSPTDKVPTSIPFVPPVSSSVGCRDANGLWHLPNPEWTPGAICTSSDPNFDGFRYPAHVAHCVRNIPMSEKDQVAKLYGIPKSYYSKYEFDHFIPLNAGGSNDITNLWPQRLDEAKDKDVVEDEVYNGLKKGTMTQQIAIEKIRAWRPAKCK